MSRIMREKGKGLAELQQLEEMAAEMIVIAFRLPPGTASGMSMVSMEESASWIVLTPRRPRESPRASS